MACAKLGVGKGVLPWLVQSWGRANEYFGQGLKVLAGFGSSLVHKKGCLAGGAADSKRWIVEFYLIICASTVFSTTSIHPNDALALPDSDFTLNPFAVTSAT